MRHEIKIGVDFANAVLSGEKTFCFLKPEFSGGGI